MTDHEDTPIVVQRLVTKVRTMNGEKLTDEELKQFVFLVGGAASETWMRLLRLEEYVKGGAGAWNWIKKNMLPDIARTSFWAVIAWIVYINRHVFFGGP